jgi:hypothetical protein
MTREDIVRMAKEVGMESFDICVELDDFAKLVAQHTLSNIDPSKFMSYQEGMEAGRLAEREACARVCELMWHQWLDSPEENEPNKPDAEDCYRAIRARGQA